MWKELRALFRKAGRGGQFLALVLLRSLFDALYTMVQAWFLRGAFLAIGNGDKAALGLACAGFGVLSAFLFLYNGTIWARFAVFTARTCASVRRLLFGAMTGASPERIEKTPRADWMTRLNVDAQLDFLTKPNQIAQAALAAVGIGIGTLALLLSRPAAFLWTLLFAVPHLLFSRFFVARPMTAYTRAILSDTAKNAADFDAILACKQTAALYDAEGFLLERFRHSSLATRRSRMRVCFRSAIGDGILPLLGWGGYLALIVAGGVWISQGTYTFGELTAALQYRGRVLAGLLLMGNCLVGMRSSLAGLKRVNETLSLEAEEALTAEQAIKAR